MWLLNLKNVKRVGSALLPKQVIQSSIRAGNEADRILKGSPDKDGMLGEVLERSSASRRIPLPLTPARPVLLLLLLPIDDVEDAATPSDDILRVLHSKKLPLLRGYISQNFIRIAPALTPGTQYNVILREGIKIQLRKLRTISRNKITHVALCKRIDSREMGPRELNADHLNVQKQTGPWAINVL